MRCAQDDIKNDICRKFMCDVMYARMFSGEPKSLAGKGRGGVMTGNVAQ